MWLWSLWRSAFLRMFFKGSYVPESLSCIVLFSKSSLMENNNNNKAFINEKSK